MSNKIKVVWDVGRITTEDLDSLEVVPYQDYLSCDECYFFGARYCGDFCKANADEIYKKKESSDSLTVDEAVALIESCRDSESQDKAITLVPSKEPEDFVNAPKHYLLFPEKNIEVRDLMRVLASQLDSLGYSGMIVSDYVQAMQYFLRWHNKHGSEDLKKGVWYINKILGQLEGGMDD
jgi:hypothetical protein